MKEKMDPSLVIRDVYKRYGQVDALRGVNLSLLPGQIHALLGENGAGKSTLARICSGHSRMDRGELFWKGRSMVWASPGEAFKRGIYLLEQDSPWPPGLTLMECLSLGRECTWWGGLLDLERACEETGRLLERVGLSRDPKERVEFLSAPERQLLGMARALAMDPLLLILDEPTSGLSTEQADRLFHFLNHMKEQGKSILFITHKLREVMRVCHRATVLRKGETVGTFHMSEITEEDLLLHMSGDLEQGQTCLRIFRDSTQEALLRVQELNMDALPGSSGIHGLSFAVVPGEIVALVGAPGNGQSELWAFLSGKDKAREGSVFWAGQPFPKGTVRLRKEGVRFVPEDRTREGLILGCTLWENHLLGGMASQKSSLFSWIRPSRSASMAWDVLKDGQVVAQGPHVEASSLSGGNQQKMILARELEGSPRLVVAVSPTRGLDPRTTQQIRCRLRNICEKGGSVLVISRDWEEVRGLADRVWVLFQGRARQAPENASAKDIMALWTGAGERSEK